VFLPIAVFRGSPPHRHGAGSEPGPVAVVPGALGDIDAWRSFAALGRRVEAPGKGGAAALAAIRSTLAALEASVWDEADALWAARSDPLAWHAAATRWDSAARAALASLA
jgi:hypothetical protein